MSAGTGDVRRAGAPLEDACAQLRQAIDLLGYDDAVYDMLAVPRREMTVSIPLRRDDGSVDVLTGADEIYTLGGVQAVVAMAVGTGTVDPVDVLVGPGNVYAAEAKRQLYGEVGIDLFAGPTEVLVIADESADSFVVATDLLSQAEHGPDSPAVLVTTSPELGRQVLDEIERQLPSLPTGEIAGAAWRDHREIAVTESLEEAYAVSDAYASEHVQVLTTQPRDALAKLTNYGSLFLGANTCVSFGDKVIGTNHVLPTRGATRYTGGLWVGKYLKTVSYQEATDASAAAELGRAAWVENFEGHARSGDIRAAALDGRRPGWATGELHEQHHGL